VFLKSRKEFLNEGFCVLDLDFVKILKTFLLGNFEAVSEASEIFVHPFYDFEVEGDCANFDFAYLIRSKIFTPAFIQIEFVDECFVALHQF